MALSMSNWGCESERRSRRWGGGGTQRRGERGVLRGGSYDYNHLVQTQAFGTPDFYFTALID